jgi:hypothetical protein
LPVELYDFYTPMYQYGHWNISSLWLNWADSTLFRLHLICDCQRKSKVFLLLNLLLYLKLRLELK